MADTVWLVKMSSFSYNDENYYTTGAMDTAAICADETVARRWVKTNAWPRISPFLNEPEYVRDERSGEWVERYPDWSDPAKRQEAIERHFQVLETTVLT